MKVLRWILLTLLGLVAFILIIALFLPKEVKIISETEINLPVNKVFYSQATFYDRGEWDPWVREDTSVIINITNVQAYVGSEYSWTSGNSGAGKIVIDSIVSNEYISYTLSFEGMKQTPKVWNQFIDRDGKTFLTWGFSQHASYPAGRIFMFFMKGKLQSDYDRGLSNLKILLEEKGVQMSSLSEIVIKDIPEFNAMLAKGQATMDQLSLKMDELLLLVLAEIQQQELEIKGVSFHHFLNFDKETGNSIFEVGFPVSKSGRSTDQVKASRIKGFSALQALHTGPYSEVGISYTKIMKYISENNINASMDAWEFYLLGPETDPDESKWRTLIVFPLKK